MQQIYTGGLRRYKELSIVVLTCKGFKALLHISHYTWASVACEQERRRPVWTSRHSISLSFWGKVNRYCELAQSERV